MPAIAHQNKILGNTSGGGSTILVTTSESTLYGQTVTLSDGTTTLTGTFSNAGECEFTGVMMVGTLTASSGGASTSIQVPYFGVYSMTLSFFSATITVTFDGGTCTCVGNGESYTASSSPYTFTVHGAATYTITNTIDGVAKTDTVTITTDGQSENVTISFGTINVTYDNAFRGTSITCTQGGTTITKTAPAGGNTMVFYPPTTGNWVISGTVSGTSYSKTANVTSLSTSVSVSLETVPDGKTTTPTDDIEKWLQCGQITGKSYTTLSQVLDDAETYERLLSDSNACDYMARSTTWALNEGEVPAMTSDTTPSGVCSASSVYSGREAYMAFDGDDTTSWTGNSITATLKYEFPQAVTITRVKLYVASNNQTVVVEGSNDDSAYTPLVSSFTLVAGSDVYKEVENPASYKYYRLTVTALAGSYAWLHTVQFYGADITTSQDAMMRLGKYDYACDALLADSTWASAIANSTYFESVCDAVVPKLSSNTASVLYSTQYDANSYPAYKAFDRTPPSQNSQWLPSNGATDNYIGYDFGADKSFARVYVDLYYGPASGQTVPALTFKVQGYTNDAWSDIDEFTIEATSETKHVTKSVDVSLSDTYSKMRLFCATALLTSAYGVGVNTLQFYGRHTAQTDIIVTAHGGDTVYYMENGSPVPLTTADSDTGIGTVDWSDLPKGAITLYSSTAKNPSDLTADYSKTVYITEYTTQIYLMPDNALYWYGCHKVPMKPYNYGISGREVAKAPTVTDGTYVVTLAQSEAYLYTGCYATTLPVNLSGASNLKAHITTVTGYDNLSSSLNSVKLETTQTLQDNYTVTASGTICTLANRSTETKTDQSGSCDVSSLLSPQYCLVTLWGKLTASLDYIILE